ncbi:Protein CHLORORESPIRATORY REDUCTION 7 chloroplastic [Zea mays]|uniref:Protein CHLORORESPIRATORY REDUCTION 7 chloroplastic n=1 Tax=Zea mays TaxID=4577 RepID=A0A1D6NB00_MAIZE|nr:Protein CHLORORESPIRATORY REDUCTION 7 chloroplastic [Zea mays]
MEPGVDEAFVYREELEEELEERLKGWLKNWPGDTLSPDHARFGTVDEVVSYLVSSSSITIFSSCQRGNNYSRDDDCRTS